MCNVQFGNHVSRSDKLDRGKNGVKRDISTTTDKSSERSLQNDYYYF